MNEYYLKSVEGKIKLHKDSISVIRTKKNITLYFNQIKEVKYKIEGPYGKIFFIFKDREIIKNIENKMHLKKTLKLPDSEKKIDNIYHFMLSFERVYENDFKIFKEYLDSYIAGKQQNFDMLDIITTQEQTQQQAEQIKNLLKQKHWENEQNNTKNNLVKNIFFIVIGTIGLIALINIIIYI